jgi:hypothetical protein
MSEDLYAACWDKSAGPAWEARHGLTAADYQSTFNTLVGKGYRLRCVSGYESDGQARYAAIWDESKGPAWEAHHGLTAAQYQTTFNQLLAKGYRLELVSGYGVGSQALYAGIWEQSPGPAWEAHHGIDATTYQNTFNQLQAKGYRLRWVSGYVVNGTDFYAAIWDKSSGGAWQARHRMSAGDYINEAASFAKQGYRQVCVSGYSFGGSDRYAALWEQPAGAVSVSHAGMPSSTYQTMFNELQAKGYHPYFVTGYEAVQPLEIVIPFEVQPQTESEWCWAAVSTSIAHFYTPSSKVTQCQVVNQQIGRTDCCVNPGSNNCNQPGFLDQALQFVGHLDSDKGQGTYQDAVGALNSGRPPCIRIGWAGGGGHFIGVNGCQPNDLLSVTDPIYGDSLVTYQTFTTGKYEGSGTWTNTFFTKP